MSYNNTNKKFNKGRNGGNSQNNGNQNTFFNCHLNAVGYINSLQEFDGQNGKFLVAQFCALEGRSDAPTHRYFNLTLTEKMAELLYGFWDEINGEQKCFANLRIGNMEFTPFQYPQDHAKYPGQLGVNCTGRLLSIQSLTIDKQRVDLEQFAPAPQPSHQKPQQQHQQHQQQNAPNQAPRNYRHDAQNTMRPADHGQCNGHEEGGNWQQGAQAPQYPSRVVAQRQPRQDAPNPRPAPVQNGYQRQGQAPRSNGARFNGQGHASH